MTIEHENCTGCGVTLWDDDPIAEDGLCPVCRVHQSDLDDHRDFMIGKKRSGVSDDHHVGKNRTDCAGSF